MPTTTNYGWTTPADTDLVKDGAAAIRTLGSSIDTTTKALNPSTTLGDIEYRSATANTNTRLGIGTAGQVLTVNSGATAPEWAAVSGGGMTLLSTTTLSGASVTLSSIPTSYNNLQIIVRNFLPTTDTRSLYIRINGDATANRHAFLSTNSASNAQVVGTFNQADIRISSDQDNAVTQSLVRVNIYDYKNTTTWKMLDFQSIVNDTGTTTSWQLQNGFGYYNQTSAITSLEFLPASGNFTSGTILLYGVK